eukprot:4729357-Pyramimonas_sp.AAC.1
MRMLRATMRRLRATRRMLIRFVQCTVCSAHYRSTWVVTVELTVETLLSHLITTGETNSNAILPPILYGRHICPC